MRGRGPTDATRPRDSRSPRGDDSIGVAGASRGAAETPGAPAQSPGRRRRFRIRDSAAPIIAVAGVLALWELLTRTGILPARYLPAMSDIIAELFSLLGIQSFWTAVWNTLQGWALGLGIAVGLAVPIGILIGSSRLLYRAMRAIIEFLRPIPSVALIPLAVLIYGTGLESKVFLAAFAAFWPMLIQTLYGVQDVDPVAADTARGFGLGQLERLWRIKLPSAMPYVATGLRISSAVSLILAVTAELVIGSRGLGQEINIARSGGALENMYALIVATGMLGWLLNIAATQGEKRVLFWHPSQREAAT